MIVSALKSQLETFRSQVIEYRDLWADSLEGPLPDYPVRNFEALKALSDPLLRQLGLLRPYLEALHASWTLMATGTAWDVLDHALGSHGAIIKGPSLNALIDGVQIAIGRLDDYPPEAEFRIGGVTTKNADIELAELVCSRFTRAARSLLTRRAGKRAFVIEDEYDGQDLLHAILRSYFKYPVRENPLSKIAGSASTRADLSIDELGLIIEVKFAKGPRDQRRIEKEISEDLVFYTAWKPLKYLFFVVVNSADLENAELLDRFSKPQAINERHFQVKVITV
jgi:hypothetical protein